MSELTDIAQLPGRDEAVRALGEQAALRRVASLVARNAPEQTVFAAVAEEVARVVGADATSVFRFDHDTPLLVAASSAGEGSFPIADGRRLDDELRELRAGARPRRFGMLRADAPSEHAVQSSVAVPICGGERVWGAIVAGSTTGPLPPGVEARVAQFAELAATAIAGARARTELRLLADEQAALRRVAELVARGVGQAELFASVAAEASKLIAGKGTTMVRFEGTGAYTVVASCGGPAPVGSRTAVSGDDSGVMATLLRTGRPTRLDDYTAVGPAHTRDDYGVTSAVAVPVVVEDALWGALGAATAGETLPPWAEQRLSQFAELIAAALANAQARAQLQQLADEQAGLRRVAELVARGVPPDAVMASVTREASALLGGAPMTLTRYEGDRGLVVVAVYGGPAPTGWRLTYELDTLPDRVRRSGRPGRVDDYTVELDAALAAGFGLAASVAAPISVEGRIWGMLTATSQERPLPDGTEYRLAQFADLVAAAISSAESRAQLQTSRARVVATADDTRRRIQRDVHDGAQQRLVQTVIALKLAREALGGDKQDVAAALVDEALLHAERAITGLRDVVRGILPAALGRGGLRAGVESLVEGVPVPVGIDVAVGRLPGGAETTGYFVIAEALTNVVKHARATRAQVSARVRGEHLEIEVRDDGAGGADAAGGSGLTGLFDRVDAGDGELSIVSPLGEGTTVRATIPLRAGGA